MVLPELLFQIVPKNVFRRPLCLVPFFAILSFFFYRNYQKTLEFGQFMGYPNNEYMIVLNAVNVIFFSNFYRVPHANFFSINLAFEDLMASRHEIAWAKETIIYLTLHLSHIISSCHDILMS